MLQLKLGIQLESLKLPFRQALQAAAELGVLAVEVNARTELRPNEMTRTGIRHIRKLLGDLNLRVCSVHFPTRRSLGEFTDLEKRLDAAKAALSMAHELGAAVVVSSIGEIPGKEDAAARPVLLQALADLARHGHRVGTWLAIRTGADPGNRLEELIAELPAGSLSVDFDPGSLIIQGHSPEDALRRLANHVVSFRAMDAVRDASGRGVHVQLGRGSVDFPLMFALLEEHHFRGYTVIERNADHDPIGSCRQTVQYLNSLF